MGNRIREIDSCPNSPYQCEKTSHLKFELLCVYTRPIKYVNVLSTGEQRCQREWRKVATGNHQQFHFQYNQCISEKRIQVIMKKDLSLESKSKGDSCYCFGPKQVTLQPWICFCFRLLSFIRVYELNESLNLKAPWNP